MAAAAGPRAGELAHPLDGLTDRLVDFVLLQLDAGGRILSWNRGAQRILGHSAEQMLGESWERLFVPESLALGLPWRLLQAAQRDAETAVEGWSPRADGEPRWCVGTLYRLPMGVFFFVSRDMTEPYEAVQRLADSEARLALALDGARMGSWHWDRRTNRSRWNAREYELLGLPAGDGHVEAGLLYRHVHPDDLSLLQRSIAEALESGTDFQHEFRVVVEGQTRWLVGAGRAQRDAQGKPVAMAGVNFDITEQRRVEQALRESEAQLQAVISNASDAIVSMDASGRINLFNPAAERIFGRSADSVLGQTVDLLLPTMPRDGRGQRLADFMHSKSPTGHPEPGGTGLVQGQRADGSRLELEGSISRAEVAGRTVSTAILRDVTERARADRALVQYQLELSGLAQHLLAQEKETTRRLAQSLHDELGQTLAALRLSFDALSSALDPVDRPPQLQRVERLIADANLQVRRVLSDLRPPLLDEQGLAPALDNELRLQGQGFGHISLVLDVTPALEPVRWPDNVEHAAFMIAREAVRNALQHAQATSVTVSLQGDPSRLVVRVQDNGGGLADGQRAGRPGHLGMVGMRERALAIGAALASSRTPALAPSFNWNGSPTMTRLYLIDDHTIMRDGLRAVLEAAGHLVVGESAELTKALAEIAVLRPDVVLLDLNLGERSGFELLDGLHKRAIDAKVIVLTMSDQPRHVAEAMRRGAMGYVLKGSPSAELLAAIDSAARGHRHLSAGTAELAVRALDVGRESALSPREQQIIVMVARGHSSTAIGEQLHLSAKTVDTYRSRLMAKLSLSDVPALVRWAIRQGLVGLDEE